MIAVVDYGVGNLFSLRSSLRFIGAESCVSADPAVLRAADKLILPGVGAFGDAADKLRQSGLDRVVTAEAERGKPLLGICLGMQLLFEKSEEYGEHAGLGLLRGRVVGMEGRLPAGLKIPHIGWNALHITAPSFYAENCTDSLIATAEYGLALTAAVQKENVMGCQFHPEKSGAVGLNILRAFCEE